MNLPDPNRSEKARWILIAVILTASASGYFMGLQQTGSQISISRIGGLEADSPRFDSVRTGHVFAAASYRDQNWSEAGVNAGWSNHLGNLVLPEPLPIGALRASEVDRAAAIEERARRRAYDGAPPVVPHPVAQESSAVCLACHGPGLAVKDKVASRISHPPYSGCTQCHVSTVGPDLLSAEDPLRSALTENSFMGAGAGAKPTRPWPQAPPVIPHGTSMRGECMSCHGPRGLFALRTPHPERQSCTQCHVAGTGAGAGIAALSL